MATKKKTFSQLMNELDGVKKALKEAYIFDDEDMGMGEMPPQEGMPQGGQGEGEGESDEEKAMHAQQIAQHEPIIMKMREIALQGLQKYSDQPLSVLYEFFKKVWMEADKVLTDAGGKK